MVWDVLEYAIAQIRPRGEVDPGGEIGEACKFMPILRQPVVDLAVAPFKSLGEPCVAAQWRAGDVAEIEKRRGGKGELPIKHGWDLDAPVAGSHQDVRTVEIRVGQTWRAGPGIERARAIFDKALEIAGADWAEPRQDQLISQMFAAETDEPGAADIEWYGNLKVVAEKPGGLERLAVNDRQQTAKILAEPGKLFGLEARQHRIQGDTVDPGHHREWRAEPSRIRPDMKEARDGEQAVEARRESRFFSNLAGIALVKAQHNVVRRAVHR